MSVAASFRTLLHFCGLSVSTLKKLSLFFYTRRLTIQYFSLHRFIDAGPCLPVHVVRFPPPIKFRSYSHPRSSPRNDTSKCFRLIRGYIHALLCARLVLDTPSSAHRNRDERPDHSSGSYCSPQSITTGPFRLMNIVPSKL